MQCRSIVRFRRRSRSLDFYIASLRLRRVLYHRRLCIVAVEG